MSKLETQRTLPRRSLYRTLETTHDIRRAVKSAIAEGMRDKLDAEMLKPKRKAKKAKRK